MKSFSQYIEEQNNGKIRVWLDDERDPKSEQGKIKGARGDEIWVKTVTEAIRLLETGTVASISLDNDLGNLDSKEEGFRVADWIEMKAAQGVLPRLAWNVHSSNAGRDRHMITALENADRFWDKNEQR